MTQLERLDALIAAATAAREAARRNHLFIAVEGLALTNAAYALFECDELYDAADQVRRELGLFEDEPLMPTEAERSRLYCGLIGRAA